MIAGALAAVVLAAQAAVSTSAHAVPGDSVRVRGVSRDTTLAVVVTPSGDALRADVVLSFLGGTARPAGAGRWTIDLPGATFGLVEGVPFAENRGEAVPLAAAPTVLEGVLLLPLQVVAALAPRLGNNVTWDASRRELRVFPLLVRRTPPAAARPAAPAANASARAPRAPTPPRRERRYTVVVDAGHGGVDPGMRGPIGGRFTIHEKDVTLAVARRLARVLDDRGIDVVMTRASDTLIALADRGRIANEHKADLFVSIHVNAANMRWKDPAAARGFETYFLDEAKTEDGQRVAAMENESVRFESGAATRDDALGFILSDMKQNEHLRESNDLAETVQASLAKVHPGPNRGVQQAPFRVLVAAFMPAVLVEIGFGTNPAEAAWVASAAGQRAIAAAVAEAALEYFAHYERRVGGAAAPRE